MTGPQRPIRVMHLTAGSDAGGVSRYLFDLCTAMRGAGHEVAIAGEHGAWHWLFEQADWPWVDLPLKGGVLELRRAARTLRHYLRDRPVDVIHCHYRRPAWVARWATRRSRLPILFTLHLSDIPMHGLWRWASYFGDHTHAASEESRQWLIDHARVPADRISVIPHGVDPARFPLATAADQSQARDELGLASDDLVAAYVGRLDDPKNVGWLLDLAAGSRGSLERLVVLIVGEGPHESALKQRIAAEGLSDRVRLLGHRDPLAVYQAADAVVLASSREGFSLVCAEAMCVGRPVLRTRTAGTHELIVEGVTGRSVAIDREAFLDAAVGFLADRDALRAMGQAAAQHVRAGLTFDQQISRTIALYEQIICPIASGRGRQGRVG